MRFLKTTDRIERLSMEAVSHEANEMMQQRDERRAVLIADAVGKKFFGK